MGGGAIRKGRIRRCGYVIFFHEVLGKDLGAFHLGCSLIRAEDGNAFGLAYVGQTFRQGHFRADDDEVYAFLFAEGSNAAQVFYPAIASLPGRA